MLFRKSFTFLGARSIHSFAYTFPLCRTFSHRKIEYDNYAKNEHYREMKLKFGQVEKSSIPIKILREIERFIAFSASITFH